MEVTPLLTQAHPTRPALVSAIGASTSRGGAYSAGIGTTTLVVVLDESRIPTIEAIAMRDTGFTVTVTLPLA